ncbi:hypothetical protein B0H17DRAFT_909078, partial [Mycena rosella]
NRSVTQSSYNAPCTPAVGGLDSGFKPPNGSDVNRFRTWNFTVNNDQQPMWFFCQQLLPVPHCNAGMVAVVNAPSYGFENFSAFQAAAQ